MITLSQVKNLPCHHICLGSDSFLFVFASGGSPAAHAAAGAGSAAGRAGPEEVLSYGHPEETQQTAHPATFQHHLLITSPFHSKLQPNLHLQIGGFCCSHSQRAFSSQLPTQLDGQAEEGQEQQPSRRAGLRVGRGWQRLPDRIARLKHWWLCTLSTFILTHNNLKSSSGLFLLIVTWPFGLQWHLTLTGCFCVTGFVQQWFNTHHFSAH